METSNFTWVLAETTKRERKKGENKKRRKMKKRKNNKEFSGCCARKRKNRPHHSLIHFIVSEKIHTSKNETRENCEKHLILFNLEIGCQFREQIGKRNP